LLYRKWIDNSIQDTKTVIYLALNNNSIIGFIACKISEYTGDITLIAVNPKFHGLGVGKSLISKLENYLINENIDKLYVATQTSNLQALKFYKQIGFNIFNKTEIYHLWK
jgi:dTDP-4-amino-4,6-dideoxy-D-galactose acyltransferase